MIQRLQEANAAQHLQHVRQECHMAPLIWCHQVAVNDVHAAVLSVQLPAAVSMR